LIKEKQAHEHIKDGDTWYCKNRAVSVYRAGVRSGRRGSDGHCLTGHRSSEALCFLK